jgi:hypothetical protein
MMKTIPALLLTALLGAPTTLLAGDRGDAILGGALGGALGAAVGSELGGRDGAILGGALGGATGTALATRRHRRPRHEVIYVDRPVYGPPRYRDYGPPPSYYRGGYPGRRAGYYKHRRDWDD